MFQSSLSHFLLFFNVRATLNTVKKDLASRCSYECPKRLN